MSEMWAVNDLAVSIFQIYPQTVASVHMHLSPFGLDHNSGFSRLCLTDES